jgi:2-methylcitrate dehydratase PrpD
MAKLDGELALEEWGLAPKLYPCCGSTHKSLDAVMDMRAEVGFSAEDVEKVETLVGYGNTVNLMYPDPQQGMEA